MSAWRGGGGAVYGAACRSIRDTARMRSLACTTFVLLLGLVAPVAAQADDCVSEQEFKKVKRGISERRVTAIFDTNGHVIFRGGGFVVREYLACVQYAQVKVSFKDGRVNRKDAYFP